MPFYFLRLSFNSLKASVFLLIVVVLCSLTGSVTNLLRWVSIRTLKENFLWVRSFETIEELRLALLEFKKTYNEEWMLEKYDYRSPAQVRRDLVGLDAAA